MAAMACIQPTGATAQQQVVQTKKNVRQPSHLLISIPDSKKQDSRQAQTQTLEQSFEESLKSGEVSDVANAGTRAVKSKKGVVRLRLARFGRKKAPFYRIHVADSRCPRDGKFLERIGYYDPKPNKDGQKKMALNFERAKYWLSVGAQPSDTVRHILSIAGLLPNPLGPQMSKRGGEEDDSVLEKELNVEGLSGKP